mmetsp:Transcript_35185/g.109962  ORF Transcript_35185/g.109962 Transcript_35185/m.109962 type:complete len:315 (-) Transcript_35185:57-1001(-)
MKILSRGQCKEPVVDIAEPYTLKSKGYGDFNDLMEKKERAIDIDGLLAAGGLNLTAVPPDFNVELPVAHEDVKIEAGRSWSDDHDGEEEVDDAASVASSSSRLLFSAGSSLDRRGKHKLVERNRRETMRKMIAELQATVGCKTRPGLHPNVSVVLEATLHWLRRKGEDGHLKKKLAAEDIAMSYQPWRHAFDLAPVGILISSDDGLIQHANILMSELSKMNPGNLLQHPKIFFSPSRNVYFPMILHVWNVMIYVNVKISGDDVKAASKLFRWDLQDWEFTGPVYKHGMSCEVKASCKGGEIQRIFVYLKHCECC